MDSRESQAKGFSIQEVQGCGRVVALASAPQSRLSSGRGLGSLCITGSLLTPVAVCRCPLVPCTS